jgi:hypothetical protein
MHKISICGKANSGKNLIAKLIYNELSKIGSTIDPVSGKMVPLPFNGIEIIAFADPIKKMAKIMFPQINPKFLYGSSKYRNEIIPGAFFCGKPLTVRQLLLDLGTGVGREYKESIWLDAFDHAFNKAQKKCKNAVIINDVRFRNEFDHLKKIGFYQIKLYRNDQLKIDHISETNQESIQDNEFDYIVYNNGTLDNLKEEVLKIVNILNS